jgi:hypothetical protein
VPQACAYCRWSRKKSTTFAVIGLSRAPAVHVWVPHEHQNHISVVAWSALLKRRLLGL